MKKLRVRYKLAIMAVSLIVILLSTIHLYRQIANKNNYYTDENDYVINLTIDEDNKVFRNTNYDNAVFAYNDKKYKLAIDELNEEVRKYPNHAQAYFLLGKIYEDIEFPEGRYYSRMISNYEEYIKLKPQGKRIRYVKLKVAQYYVQIGLTQRNIEFLNKAEEYLQSLDKTDSSVRMALGAIYLDKENYDKAIVEFEKSANLTPDELKLKYNSLGLAYIKKGLFANAENFLSIAIKIDPKDKYAHNNLGFVYAQQGKLQDAKKHFTKALEIDPTYSNAKKNLLWVERETKKREK